MNTDRNARAVITTWRAGHVTLSYLSPGGTDPSVGRGWMQAHAERLLGRVALAAGEAKEAERYVHDALSRLAPKDFMIDIPECLDILAAIAAAAESFEEAARLLGAAAAGRERLGIVRFPLEPDFWTGVERTTREAVGDD
ncbi:MAG: hypothetical protein ACRDTJ_33100, partial [Pseudonocardiaceae bacterium]